MYTHVLSLSLSLSLSPAYPCNTRLRIHCPSSPHRSSQWDFYYHFTLETARQQELAGQTDTSISTLIAGVNMARKRKSPLREVRTIPCSLPSSLSLSLSLSLCVYPY
eukprot:TRINITY_DN4554_c0_g2_i2.p1 TRINITY_DN4554_c0_g2~~TRINITY_DN4554_c0_g2_i2.p1  ORF type:complete len:107 (-),score=30.26 TRINITY_DN4554_c0_g2_i2:358-678(-)